MTTNHGRKVRRVAGLAVAAAFLSTGPVMADDGALRERIEARLAKADLAEQGQIEVEVRDGVAVLTGFTTTVAGQRQAEKAARKETRRVESRLRVVPAPRTDADIRDSVVDAVLGYTYYGVFDSVGVAVDGGVVTLQGSVRQPLRKSDLEQRVARLEGIREVRNDIRVQPVSTFDDRLRRQLYHQIYGSGFFRYAGFANPPIHIVVENGNITLTGVVNSRVERAKLESIARGTLAFRVDNQVEVESDRGKEPARRPSTES
jgi:hyperosmotically inducible protein